MESNTAVTKKITVDGKRLFIKSGNPSNPYHKMALREAEFYKFINNAVNVIPHCYEAYVDGNDFKIILDDIDCREPDLHDEKTWLLCAESLAEFHAVSWNRPPDHIEDAEKIISDCEEAYQKFTTCINGRYDEVYREVLKINAELVRGQKNSVNTIVNGDSHIHNFIFPKDSIKPLIIDFQFWGTGSGTGDLAHLTRVDFPDKFRKSLHRPIAETYHNKLLACGIPNYTFEECYNDYKMHVATMLLIPMWQYVVFGLPYESWGGHIDGLIENYKGVTL